MIKIPKVKLWATQDIALKYGRGCARSSVPELYTPFYDEYSVTVNGEECPVRQCRVSAKSFNVWWPGHQRDISQSELAGFISFSGDEAVTLRVKRKSAYKKAVLRPVSKNIVPEICGDEVVFTITENGNYVLELDDEHNCLHIFYNKIKEYPDAKDATYYFGPGLHYPGIIKLNSNESVYVDEEAIVFGGINAIGAENIRIFGGGTIDNSVEERVIEHCYENFTVGTFRIYDCKNVSVEDVIFMNSSTWIISMFYCNGVKIDGVKIVGHWRYNTDGIDIVNTSNVTIKNSFVRAFDDVITIKGIYNYVKTIENIFVDNCVLWCGWGHSCELGVETWAPEYKNIHFKNCDVIRIAGPALAICNGMDCEIHDVSYENINVEMQADTMVQVLQTSEDQEYDPYGPGMRRFRLIYFANDQYTIGSEGVRSPKKIFCEKVGYTHDVLVKNVNLYTDDESILPIIDIYSLSEDRPIENITLEDIYLNGEKIESFDKFNTVLKNHNNVVIK